MLRRPRGVLTQSLERHPMSAALEEIRNKRPLFYETVEIDLSVARTNQAFDVPGDMLAVLAISGSAFIRMNEPADTHPPVSLSLVRKFDTAFFRFFITNTAQTGRSLSLLIGRDAGFNVPVLLASTRVTDSLGTDVDPANRQLFIPLDRGWVHNQAATANTNILGAAITPTNTPCLIRCLVQLSTAGIFSVMLDRSGSIARLRQNGGIALAAECGYIFDTLVRTGDALNFQTDTAGNVTLRLQEIVGGVQ